MKTPLQFATRACTALCLLLLALPSLSAQATRTWVSGVGDDVNPCSRTEPGKTFAGAISKTAAGGEIDCLDSGGFGPVTIVKSITIDGGGALGSILNANTTGIIIRGDNIVVTLRHLTIQGAGNGLCGIKVLNCAVLNIENCVISSQAGRGIEVVPGSNARVFIKDTLIRGNDNNPNGGGIRIAPEATFSVTAFLDNVRLEGNLYGLQVEDRVTATARNCVAAGNATDGFSAAGSAGPISLNLEGCVAASNGTFGIRNANADADSVIRLSNVTVVGNGTGVGATGKSSVVSFGNNRIDGNSVDGAATTTKAPK